MCGQVERRDATLLQHVLRMGADVTGRAGGGKLLEAAAKQQGSAGAVAAVLLAGGAPVGADAMAAALGRLREHHTPDLAVLFLQVRGARLGFGKPPETRKQSQGVRTIGWILKGLQGG